jgi:hypothetical protein
MEIIRGIPNQYLYIGCTIVSMLFFYAGGTAFSQSPFYGALFIVLALVLFFTGVYFGRKSGGVE